MVQHRQTRVTTKDDWQTPVQLFKKLDNRFSFTGDACASADNALSSRFFTEKTDALRSNWSDLGDSVFINPPYSKSHEFVARSWRAVRDGEVKRVVAVVPSTCEVRWFHDYVIGKASEIWFTKGRINFINPETGSEGQSNVVGTAIIVWDGARVGWTNTSIWGMCSKTFEPTGHVSNSVFMGAPQVSLI